MDESDDVALPSGISTKRLRTNVTYQPVPRLPTTASQQVVAGQQTQTVKSNTAKNFTGTWRFNANANQPNQRLNAIENAADSTPKSLKLIELSEPRHYRRKAHEKSR